MKIGRFELDMDGRCLRLDRREVRLGSRALDLLITLATARGQVVSRTELMKRVWPGTIVEDCNIDVNMSALRKALGEDRDLIITIARRGYRLVTPQDVHPAQPTAARQLPLARRLGIFIGRDAEAARAAQALMETSVLTLTGAAGVGKSSLALAVAHRVAPPLAATVAFVDLTCVATAEEVLRSIAHGCGVEMPGGAASPESLGAALSGAARLLVLDGAERAVAVVAHIVDALLAQRLDIQFLVTSREPLRIHREIVFRVRPLAVPKTTDGSEEILKSPAVQLFIHHAQLMHWKSVSHGAEVKRIAEICRRLDGIPLAIELAAGRVKILGVEGVRRCLSEGLSFLSGGYRTAASRHRGLVAAFDASFDLLSHLAQSLLVRLHRYTEPFNFASLRGLVSEVEMTTDGLIEGVEELVSKSLLNVCLDGPEAMYSLFECTRTYAAEKLQCTFEECACGFKPQTRAPLIR